MAQIASLMPKRGFSAGYYLNFVLFCHTGEHVIFLGVICLSDHVDFTQAYCSILRLGGELQIS